MKVSLFSTGLQKEDLGNHALVELPFERHFAVLRHASGCIRTKERLNSVRLLNALWCGVVWCGVVRRVIKYK